MPLTDLDLPLGRAVPYPQAFAPEELRALPRIHSTAAAAPYGADHWMAHEHSWLGPTGRPASAVLKLRVPLSSSRFIESKSLKLYLLSFALTRWPSTEAVEQQIRSDIEQHCGSAIDVRLSSLTQSVAATAVPALGDCIDSEAIECDEFRPAPDVLRVGAGAQRTERLHSHVLRSLCPVTGQPDHATLVIDYVGEPLDRASLLQYVVGFRSHQAFHEQLIDTIYADVQQRCAPTSLCVMGLFCRRGGIDIVPVRSSRPWLLEPPRTARQ